MQKGRVFATRKLPKRRLRNALTAKVSSIKNCRKSWKEIPQRCPRNALKAIEPPASKTGQNRCQRCFCRNTFETLEQQQDSSPCQAKCSPTKCFPLPLEPIKKSSFVRHPGCGRSSETIGASPLEAEFRHTRTAAACDSMPSKMQPDKMLPLTFGTTEPIPLEHRVENRCKKNCNVADGTH